MQRILVIDDDEQMRTLLAKAMEWAGFEVITADNGRRGQLLFEEQPADLVITDLIMPEQEGLETIRSLKRIHPRVRIIAISGGGSAGGLDYLTVARSLGARYTFAKPVDRQELLGAIASVFAE